MAALERALERSRAPRKIIATDAVFSMDGDLAPLPRLLELADAHDAWLVVDDAHGFGVLGEGRGSLAHFGLASERIIYMATLGKAAGVAGAFVAAHPVGDRDADPDGASLHLHDGGTAAAGASRARRAGDHPRRRGASRATRRT